jgi:hypothetical protein
MEKAEHSSLKGKEFELVRGKRLTVQRIVAIIFDRFFHIVGPHWFWPD